MEPSVMMIPRKSGPERPLISIKACDPAAMKGFPVPGHSEAWPQYINSWQLYSPEIQIIKYKDNHSGSNQEKHRVK